jgi:cardiolipin synthase
MILKNIPNVLSIIRLILLAPFLVCLYQQEYQYAFYIFLIAGISDGLDGWIARHFGWQSAFGSFIDPLADKLLIASSFIAIALIGNLPWWLVILVFSRDLTISIGVIAWHYLVQRDLIFKPTLLSKANTTFQLALLTFSMFNLAFFEIVPYLIDTLIIVTAITTSLSFIDYVYTWGKKAYASIDHKNE